MPTRGREHLLVARGEGLEAVVGGDADGGVGIRERATDDLLVGRTADGAERAEGGAADTGVLAVTSTVRARTSGSCRVATTFAHASRTRQARLVRFFSTTFAASGVQA